MKKLFLAILAVCMLCSCEEWFSERGQADFCFGFSEVNSGASILTDMSVIEDAYKTELAKIGGGKITSGTLQFEDVVYKTVSREVLDACHNAETALSGTTFNGSYTFHVQAVYFATGEIDDGFYSHHYGTN